MNWKRLLPTRWYMRLAWERRARRNAMHYVADFREQWEDPAEFLRSGLDDVEAFLSGAQWGDTSGGRLLEIGCGLGRMTCHLAERFAHVDAVDISPTMIRGARDLHRKLSNVQFHVGSGVDLRLFGDGQFDFVLSYIVFQHIPEEAVVHGYIREALRVLKASGRLRFQARNDAQRPGADTYNGTSIQVEDVRRLAAEAGRDLLRVEGEGTQYCFFDIGPA